MTASMTAVVEVNLTAQYPNLASDFELNENDLLAAFVGDVCVDVRQPQDGLFFLFMAAPLSADITPVTLRYWSANYKNLFEAPDAFPFVNDSHFGTISSPAVPSFLPMTPLQ